MKRLLYLDKKSNEIDAILSSTKNVIIRAANIKKYPYKMIFKGYRVYFMNNNSEDIILASATVKEAIFFEQGDTQLDLKMYLEKAQLRKEKRDYILKRKYISVFILEDVKEEYAKLKRGLYGTKEDWMVIEPIDNYNKG